MPLLKFPGAFQATFIAHYLITNELDQNVVNELIPQYFITPFALTDRNLVSPDTLSTLIAVKLAADEHRRRKLDVPSNALLLLTMVGERPCTSPLNH